MIDCNNLVKPTNPEIDPQFIPDGYDQIGNVFFWDNINYDEDFYVVERSEDNGVTWNFRTDQGAGIYWYFDFDVVFGKEYCYRAAPGKWLADPLDRTQICLGEWTDTVCYSNIYLPWCSINGYEITGATCGNNDGIVKIINYEYVYRFLYDFTITDSFGNNIPIPINGIAIVPSGFYFIKAIPKTNYLRDTCLIEWLPVVDSNTTCIINTTIFSDAVCGSFNKHIGRAIIEITGLIEPFKFYLYSDDKKMVTSGLTNNTIILNDLKGGKYHLILDDDVCKLVWDFFIKEELLYSVPNIKEIYVSEWDKNVDWNYWSTENDQDYYGGLDTLKFQSTKIKEFINTNQWYYIPVDEANVSFNQEMTKVRQGFIFTDTLSIAIDNNNASKWKTLTSVLKNKYIVVFKDNNDYWWTFGFRHGAETKDYEFGSDLGGFKLTFSSKSEANIITALNIDYIQATIFN